MNSCPLLVPNPSFLSASKDRTVRLWKYDPAAAAQSTDSLCIGSYINTNGFTSLASLPSSDEATSADFIAGGFSGSIHSFRVASSSEMVELDLLDWCDAVA